MRWRQSTWVAKELWEGRGCGCCCDEEDASEAGALMPFALSSTLQHRKPLLPLELLHQRSNLCRQSGALKRYIKKQRPLNLKANGQKAT